MSISLLDSTTGLADGGDFNVGPSTSNAGWEAHNIVATGSCEIYIEADVDGDGNYEITPTDPIASITSGSPMKMGFLIELTADGSGNNEVRLRINNTSGSTIDVFVTGEDGS